MILKSHRSFYCREYVQYVHVHQHRHPSAARKLTYIVRSLTNSWLEMSHVWWDHRLIDFSFAHEARQYKVRRFSLLITVRQIWKCAVFPFGESFTSAARLFCGLCYKGQGSFFKSHGWLCGTNCTPKAAQRAWKHTPALALILFSLLANDVEVQLLVRMHVVAQVCVCKTSQGLSHSYLFEEYVCRKSPLFASSPSYSRRTVWWFPSPGRLLFFVQTLQTNCNYTSRDWPWQYCSAENVLQSGILRSWTGVNMGENQSELIGGEIKPWLGASDEVFITNISRSRDLRTKDSYGRSHASLSPPPSLSWKPYCRLSKYLIYHHLSWMSLSMQKKK